MKKKWLWIAFVAAVLIMAVARLWIFWDRLEPALEPATAPISDVATGIIVSSPTAGSKVSSPATISGSAPGAWYFEAVFPIFIVDWDGRILAQGQAHATADWTTAVPVPFEASIPFVPPECGPSQDYCHRGSIIFKNDNPSGDPAKSRSFEFPVTFQ